MKTPQESLESERLSRIINEKEAYYRKLFRQDPGNQYLTILNSEITFLRDIIMPIILQNTTVLYSEISSHVTKAMRAIEKRQDKEKFCGVLLYYQIHKPEPGSTPRIAFASNIRTYNEVYVDLEMNGRHSLVTPVFPEIEEKEKEEFFAEQAAKLHNIYRNIYIDTTQLKPSTQKFVNPLKHG
ncbi:MAG: hypothetical protein J5644_05250 [Bacteroidales bacterium]|nr:hypothetical protein [Bacteroidales bacterium]